MFTNYQEVLEYLYRTLPMFQRVGAIAFKRDLFNTIELCKVFDDPQAKFKSVHVTGTNGKGSSSHMLASILQSAGYKTGLYTSPHLKEFTERIKINGQEVNQEFVIDFVNKVRPHIDLLKPSFFEITVVMAFEYFAQQEVDVAIIEVGLGGRLDSTNVIVPEVSLITNIGYDHVALLGGTLQKIAFEKAGIIKHGVPVVISQRQPEVESVFRKVAAKKKSPIHYAIYEYSCKGDSNNPSIQILKNSVAYLDDIKFPLRGSYQMKNLPGVMKTIELLEEKGFILSKDSIKHGLQNVLLQTGLKGRWQQLGEKPFIICDTGHNVDGVQEVVNQINTYFFEKLFIVWGMVNDKDREEIFDKLPPSATYFFCQAKIPRALDAHELAIDAAKFGLKGEVMADVNDAIKRAKSLAGPNDFIFVGGSTFVVAEIKNLYEDGTGVKRKQERFRVIEERENVIERSKPIYKTIKNNWNTEYFKNENPVTIELACGRGEYTVGLAELFPDRNFIGVDIKGERIWKGSSWAVEKELQNVAFLRTHILYIEEFFEPGEVDEIWITFPDPRPRKRDIKRRLTNPRFLEMYKRLVRPGGFVRLKTDNTNLFNYTLEELQLRNDIIDLAFIHDVYASDLRPECFDIKTRYEEAFASKGETIKYLRFRFKYEPTQ